MSWIGLVEVRPKRQTLKTIPRLHFFKAASHLVTCGILMCIVRDHVTNVCCLSIEKRNMPFYCSLSHIYWQQRHPFLSSREKAIYRINQ